MRAMLRERRSLRLAAVERLGNTARLEPHAALHHEADVPHEGDVVQRIAGHGDHGQPPRALPVAPEAVAV